MPKECDFNKLERVAQDCIENGRIDDALRIYMYMADGDNSLDGGYLGWQIGRCYELKRDLVAARYWYGRAVEENPEVAKYHELRDKLPPIGLNDLLV